MICRPPAAPLLRVAAIRSTTTAEGPFARAALWVQGCTIRCAGCFNPHTWDPLGGVAMNPQDVVAALMEDASTEGITVLGGEPFEQSLALATICREVRSQGKGVIAFSGSTLEELQARGGEERALLAEIDLLIDGPFRRTAPDLIRPLVGSTNQRFHCLTPRYANWVESLSCHPDRLEVMLAADGAVSLTGWAPDAVLEDLLNALEVRRQPRQRH